MSRPTVHVIGTGGTIAGQLLPSGEVRPHLTIRQVLDRVPTVSGYARVTAEDFSRVSSVDLELDRMLSLARRVSEVLAEGTVSGIVITHGTTTLELTAYLIDTVLGNDEPVVVTGAMRNPTLPSDDGPINLLNAVQVAASPRSRGLGVLVVMNGYIHAARDVTKSHSSNVDAFQSPEFGPLGAVDEDYVFYARRPFRRLPAVMPETVSAAVGLIPFGVRQEDVLRQTLQSGGFGGLVIETTMVGPGMLEGIVRALGQGIAVVMANPFGAGRILRRTYRREGSEQHLLDLGVAFAGTSAQKARVKLTIALSAGVPPSEIRRLFAEEWE